MQSEIAKLPPEEFRKSADWMDEQRASAWVRQIEEDARSGKLDFLSKELDDDIAAGRTHPIDEICNDAAISPKSGEPA
jgi:hypothetical protein